MRGRATNRDKTARVERRVRLFRNGRNQALRIPREFEFPGTDAVVRREGDTLVVEPARRGSLLSLLASWKPLRETFPNVDDGLLSAEKIRL